MSGQRASVHGIGVDVTIYVSDWAALGRQLADASTGDRASLLGAFALATAHLPLDTAVVAERILLAEKDDPEARATREAVQRFCRELLEHLDEGSR